MSMEFMGSSLVLAIFCLILILFFKKQVADILESFGKKTKIEFCPTGGFNIELGSDEKIATAGQQEQNNAQYFSYSKAYQSQIITDEEKLIQNQLAQAKCSNSQAVAVLIYQLANTKLLNFLLIIDKNIYPEQVELLAFLNTQSTPCTELQLQPFYIKWQNRTRDDKYQFIAFLNFLQNFRLVFLGIDGYTISPMGKEYLKFLVNIGRNAFPEHKTNKENSFNSESE